MTKLILILLTAFQGTPSAEPASLAKHDGKKKPKSAVVKKRHSLLARDTVVRVVLKNGNVFIGVAKRGRIHEKRERADYVVVKDRKVAGAGIRIWWWGDTPGFLFLKHRDIKVVEPVRQLSSVESNLIVNSPDRSRLLRSICSHPKVAIESLIRRHQSATVQKSRADANRKKTARRQTRARPTQKTTKKPVKRTRRKG